MSYTSDQAFVEAFDDNLQLLSQQFASRLAGRTRIRTGIKGESTTFERLAQSAAISPTGRHSDSPLVSTTHSRRWAVAEEKEWGELLDQDDEIKMLISPTSSYMRTGIAALERAKDDVIIAALLGSAKSGKDGSGSVALPNGQKIAVSSAGLTVAKLREARKLLLQKDVMEMDLSIAVGAKQLDDLLSDSLLQNKDTNLVAALVEGKINRYLGFDFVRSERLTTDTNGDRQIIAFGKQGVGFSIWKDNNGRVAERSDKRFSEYVYVWNSIGAVRIEDEQVIEIACGE